MQDQYEKVCTHTDLGIEFLKRVQTFMEKRITVELNYAKELRWVEQGEGPMRRVDKVQLG